MPYIIAVLALIILGTGYTLFQKSADPLPESSDTPLSVTVTETGTSSESLTTLPEGTVESQENVPKEVADNTVRTTPPSNTTKPSSQPTQNPTPEPSTPAPADSNTYTNGTYVATKSYRTPDGTYQMNVSVTVKDDTVTASTLSFDADGARDGYSKRFSNGYQSQVIGKNLGNVNLSRVGGASLTTNAFNSALSSIKSQAS